MARAELLNNGAGAQQRGTARSFPNGAAELLSNGAGAQQRGTARGFPNGAGMKKGGYIAATFSL